MSKKFLSFSREFEIESRLVDSAVSCSSLSQGQSFLEELELVRLVLALLKHPLAPLMLGESILFRLADLIWENYGKD